MPRKSRFEFDPHNTAPDGRYIVGKGHPPEHGKFRAGDGRKRGRKPKGTKNLATDFREEFDSRVTVTVGGVAKTVSRQRAVVMRLADNATKGQNPAIELALKYNEKLVLPMLEREGQGESPARHPGLSCLTNAEAEAMLYLTMKVEGLVDEDFQIVGVIPVYKEGHYFGTLSQPAIRLIDLDPSELHRVGCRIVCGIGESGEPDGN